MQSLSYQIAYTNLGKVNTTQCIILNEQVKGWETPKDENFSYGIDRQNTTLIHIGVPVLYQGMLPVKVLSSPQRLVQPRKVSSATKSHHCHPSLLVTLVSSTKELLHQVKEGISLDPVHQVATAPHQAWRVDVTTWSPGSQVLLLTRLQGCTSPIPPQALKLQGISLVKMNNIKS